MPEHEDPEECQIFSEPGAEQAGPEFIMRTVPNRAERRRRGRPAPATWGHDQREILDGVHKYNPDDGTGR